MDVNKVGNNHSPQICEIKVSYRGPSFVLENLRLLGLEFTMGTLTKCDEYLLTGLMGMLICLGFKKTVKVITKYP